MKTKVSGKEFAWYLVGSTIAVLGLILIIFGIIGHHLPVTNDNNFIKAAEESVKSALHVQFGFRIWGLIIVAFGLVIDVIALIYNAKKADRDYEKNLRRQQRQEALKNSTIEVKSAVEIIEEPAAPAPSNE